MAIVHSFTKYQDGYTLLNQGVASFNYQLVKIDTCTQEQTVIIDTTLIVPETIQTIVFGTDGTYNLILSQTGQENIVIPILFYKNLLLSFINDVKNVVCGCKCVDCDCEDSCESNLITLTKGITYYTLNSNDLSVIYNCVSQSVNCNLSGDIICMLTQEMILGKCSPNNLIKTLIANFYLTFYYAELNNSLDTAETEYIKTKYNYAEIARCIKLLGIDVTNIPCNPPIIETQECKEWIWDLTMFGDLSQIVSIKYYKCGTSEETNLTGPISTLGRTVTLCTNGTQPIINIGTLSSGDICQSIN